MLNYCTESDRRLWSALANGTGGVDVDARRAGTGSWIAEFGGGSAAHHVPEEHRPGRPGVPHATGTCGRVFLPAALSTPLGPPCPLCVASVDLALRRDAPPDPRPARTTPTLRVGRPTRWIRWGSR